MKSSILVAAGAVSLAMGGPLMKRKMITTWVVDYYTVTVTGAAETPKPTLPHGEKHRPDTTTSIPVVVVTVTPDAPAPQPTTSIPEPAVVVVTETYQAPSAPTTVASPVEEAPAATSPATPTATSAPEDPAGDDYPSMAVYRHNLHRSNHSAPEITWSDKLAGYASNTAATCHFAHDMDQGGGGYGQNIASWGLSSGASKLGDVGALKMAITDFWYNGEFHNFLPEFYGEATPSNTTDFEKWGHFTQLLWKASNEVGCASQYCESGTMYSGFDSWFTVCNYGPQGNVGGAYGDNVLRPLGKSVMAS
ncbi:PR-1-like protein [Hypoxylon sp. NC1633]|nr:PR-1-like protein [Hypoxylon sp. NC1633]